MAQSGSPQTLVFAMLGFAIILAGIVTITTDIMAGVNYNPTNNFSSLQTMVDEKSNITKHLHSYGDTANQNPEDKDRNFFVKGIQFIISRFEDTMLGKAFKTISLVYNSIKIFSEYAGSMGGLLPIPDWVAHTITTFFSLLVVFGVIYFFRGIKP